MREQCLSPDLYTFSALAKGCTSRPDAEQLLNEITVSQYSRSLILALFCGWKDLNLKPNQKILDSMLKNAFFLTNFPLLAFICESYRTHNLPVNEDALRRIEKFLLDTRSKILAMVCRTRCCSNRLNIVCLGTSQCGHRAISTSQLNLRSFQEVLREMAP